MRKLRSRKHLRWRDHNYALPGAYFVTTVTHRRALILGTVTRNGMAPSHAGFIVAETWQHIPQRFPGSELDTFVVMPDHVHAIIFLHGRPEPGMTSLSQIIGWAKSRSAQRINDARSMRGRKVWQASFHDHIIRTSHALHCIRRYITANPSTAWRELTARNYFHRP